MDEDGVDAREGLRSVGAGLRLVLIGLVATIAAEVGFGAATATVVQQMHAEAEKKRDQVDAAEAKDKDGDRTDLRAEMAKTYQANRKSSVLRSLYASNPGAATALNAMVVLACVLGIAGKVFCARGPAEAGAAPFAVSSIVFDLLGLALYAAGQAAPLGEESADLVDLAPLPWLIAYFLLLRYVGRLSALLGSARLAGRVRRQQFGSFGLLIVTLLAAGLAASAGLLGLLVTLVVVNLGMVALIVLYVRLLLDARRAAERAADSA